MINNPSTLCYQTPPVTKPLVNETKRVTETISVAVLDSNGNPTDEVRSISVVKTVSQPSMLIDQTLSADDLTIQNCLENGIPLGDFVGGNFLSSENPDIHLQNLSSVITSQKDTFIESIPEPSNVVD